MCLHICWGGGGDGPYMSRVFFRSYYSSALCWVSFSSSLDNFPCHVAPFCMCHMSLCCVRSILVLLTKSYSSIPRLVICVKWVI